MQFQYWKQNAKFKSSIIPNSKALSLFASDWLEAEAAVYLHDNENIYTQNTKVKCKITSSKQGPHRSWKLINWGPYV